MLFAAVMVCAWVAAGVAVGAGITKLIEAMQR